jgi:elongation factor 1 alpha-like protein
VTAAIGGGGTAALLSPPTKPSVKPDSSDSESIDAVTTTTKATATMQSFTPTELKAFAKAEEKAQLECLKLHEKETTGEQGKTKFRMIVIGHVDAGKSTITGHVLYKLGYVSKKLMHKFE